MELLGKVQQGMFSANISMTMTVGVDQNGQPKITITQEDFGPLPAPQGLNDAVSAFVAQALTGSLGPAATGFRLESVSIADGVMTVTGRIKSARLYQWSKKTHHGTHRDHTVRATKTSGT